MQLIIIINDKTGSKHFGSILVQKKKKHFNDKVIYLFNEKIAYIRYK